MKVLLNNFICMVKDGVIEGPTTYSHSVKETDEPLTTAKFAQTLFPYIAKSNFNFQAVEFRLSFRRRQLGCGPRQESRKDRTKVLKAMKRIEKGHRKEISVRRCEYLIIYHSTFHSIRNSSEYGFARIALSFASNFNFFQTILYKIDNLRQTKPSVKAVFN